MRRWILVPVVLCTMISAAVAQDRPTKKSRHTPRSERHCPGDCRRHLNLTTLSMDCPFGVGKATERLKEELRHREIPLFAVIDHEKNAREVGMTMASTQVLLFGSPKAGTPLMQKVPEFALRLPLRIAIIGKEDGTCKLVAPKMKEEAKPYGLGDHPTVQQMDKLLEDIMRAAVSEGK